MTKQKMLELWNKMLKSNNVQKEFNSMAFGRHGGKIKDGWRKLILRKENAYIEITFERSPVGYLIYSGDYRFELGKGEVYEQMCIDFDRRGTLYEGTEMTIDRIDELL